MFFTIVINYPTTLDALTRWSNRLYTTAEVCGSLGALLMLTGIVLGFMGKPLLLAVGVAVFGLLLGAPMSYAESLRVQVDERRFALLDGTDADETEQPTA